MISLFLADPSITTHPLSQTVDVSGTATFFVEASGATSFQWYVGENIISDGMNITGATTDTLTIMNVVEANEGNYSVRVSNGGDTVDSDPATLTVVCKFNHIHLCSFC